MEYKVSLITTVYNCLPYLKEAIRSVERQTIGFENIEYIVVDDCSEDGCYEFLSKWAQKHGNVKLLRTDSNSGSENRPRNIGLQHVSADYVMFLDADDLLDKNAVNFLYQEITQNAVDMASMACAEYSARSSKKQLQACEEKTREGIYYIERDAVEDVPVMNPITTKIYKTAVLKENHVLFDETLVNGVDNVFFFKYMMHIKTIKYTRYAGYFYRIRLESLSHAYSKKYFLNMLNTISALKKLYYNTSFYQYYRMFLISRTDIFMDVLCDCDVLSDQETEEILREWRPVLREVGALNAEMETAVGKILVDDAKKDDFDAMKFHFFALRPMYQARKRQLNDIFSSRGWRLLTAVNRVLGR